MLPFFDAAGALTDRDGNFVIAPKLEPSFGRRGQNPNWLPLLRRPELP